MAEEVVLITHEGDRVPVSRKVTQVSEFVACRFHAVAAECSEEIDVGDLEIDTQVMSCIAEYCNHHEFKLPALLPSPLKKGAVLSELFDSWSLQFLDRLDDDSKLRLIQAAKALGITPLVQMIAASISVPLMGKSEEEFSELMLETVHLDARQESYLQHECPWVLVSVSSREREFQSSPDE